MVLGSAPCNDPDSSLDTSETAAPCNLPSLFGLPSDLLLRCLKGRLFHARETGKHLQAIVDRTSRVNIWCTRPEKWLRMGFSSHLRARQLTINRPNNCFRALEENDMSALCAWLQGSQGCKIEHLTIQYSLDTRGAILLAATLKSCQELQVLDLSHNRMGDDGLLQISHALQHMPSLEDVDLQRSSIGNAGLSSLLPLLKEDGNLTYLRLQRNPISRPGHQMLEDCGVQNMDRVYTVLAHGENTKVSLLLRRVRKSRCWSVLCWKT